ncbi:unnamed protein product [Adineta steineri]|uniref:Uncharacterized protein n=1 Tax=Adineta steineri TaxID=433720 RepID=A0A815DCL8_9BILA|nr:unnamed protein product [Adineta steineri]CAF1299043.1 unnamed protein product [Adineta steineri]
MRIKILFQFLKQNLLKLNLFKSIPRSEDETILQQQRYQTRLYLVLLLMSLIIFIFSVFDQSHTINVTVNSPSVTRFTELYTQYPFTLDCPCSQTSLEYNQFIFNITPHYHEICSSEFIFSRWIELQFIESPVRVFFTNDIRYQSRIHFQLLSTLCRIAQQTVNDSLQSFYRTKFITNKVITLSSFKTQVDSIIEQFKRTVPGSYQHALELIQANPEVNQLIVPLNSDFVSTKDIYNNEVFSLKPARHVFDYRFICKSPSNMCLCYVLFPNECVLETIIRKGTLTKKIPRMYQTLFPLRSVLLSTLECFYNDTCLSYITREINSVVSPTNFSTLNLSLLSIDESPYDPINILANKLFIQNWSNQSLYESYFNQCYPLTCQYTYESQFNIIYIITSIIGLLGGLHIVLQLVTRYTIKLSYKIWTKMISRRQNNTISTGETASIRTGKGINTNF